MAPDMKSSIRRFRISRPPTQSPTTTAATGRAGTVSRAADRAPGPACDRCRAFKKKCSRTFPVCQLCASAGQRCSFSSPVSAQHLKARVEWLSQIINSHGSAAFAGLAANIEAVETGAEVLPPALTDADTSPAADSEISAATTSGRQREVSRAEGSESARFSPSRQLSDGGTAGPQAARLVGPEPKAASTLALPADVTPRRLVHAYFSNVNRAYPFIDRAKVLHTLESCGNPLQRGSSDADATILYLVMAIGYTTIQRAGQIAEDAAAAPFHVAYKDILREFLCEDNIESLQILVLLALYSLFDPAGVSPWSIVGVVSRQAVLLGVTRKASEEASLSAQEIELRHRLYWSVYVLDRMVAASLGLPMALTDDQADVPLPGLTIEEFTSSDRASHATLLQTSRHVIRLRQLEDRILRQIHFRKPSEACTLTHADRRATIQDIQAGIENWYSNGCLISPPEPDNLPIHSSITWLSARYYHLLLLLHYPCRLDLFGPTIPRTELLRFAQKHLQSTSVLFQQRLLPLNRITLCRLFPVALVLMNGFVWCAVKGVPFPARDEVAVIASILDAFPAGWVHAQSGAALVKQFLGVVSSLHSYYEPLHFNSHSHAVRQRKESYRSLVRPLVTAMLDLVYELLGRATSFAYEESFEEDEPPAAAARLCEENMQYGTDSSVYLDRGALMEGTSLAGAEDGTSDEDIMGFGWTGLELDFL
ncbi:hypothetical protein VTK73DRAFT_5861 [Phialemonium thermophilum]|uniref:Zn(2)-C6 fungal-type domain-containing protein n=1 Tax=Phialemonium thermophilum TaxID=223376 RepID=A0ABR3WLI3_9PEZI